MYMLDIVDAKYVKENCTYHESQGILMVAKFHFINHNAQWPKDIDGL